MCGQASLASLSATFLLLVDSVGQALGTQLRMRGGEGNRQEPLLRAQEESWGVGGPEGAVGGGRTERWFIRSTWHLGSVAMQPELFGIQRLLDCDS